MFGLGRSKVREGEDAHLQNQVDALRAEIERTQSAVRTLEAEQIALHDQVRKWMRRAVAAERNQARAEGAPPAPRSEPPAPSLNLWGARGRILARRQNGANGDASHPPAETGDIDGLHP